MEKQKKVAKHKLTAYYEAKSREIKRDLLLSGKYANRIVENKKRKHNKKVVLSDWNF